MGKKKNWIETGHESDLTFIELATEWWSETVEVLEDFFGFGGSAYKAGQAFKAEQAMQDQFVKTGSILKPSRGKRVLKAGLFVFMVLVLGLISASVVLVNNRYNFHAYHYDTIDMIQILARRCIHLILGLGICWVAGHYGPILYKLKSHQWLWWLYGSLVLLAFKGAHGLMFLFYGYVGLAFRVALIVAFFGYLTRSIWQFESDYGTYRRRGLGFTINLALVNLLFLLNGEYTTITLLHLTIILYLIYTRRFYMLKPILYAWLGIIALAVTVPSYRLVRYLILLGLNVDSTLTYGGFGFGYQEMNALKMIVNSHFWGCVFTGEYRVFYLPSALEAYSLSVFYYMYGIWSLFLMGAGAWWGLGLILRKTNEVRCIEERDYRILYGFLIVVLVGIGILTSVGLIEAHNVGMPFLGADPLWTYMFFIFVGQYGILE